MSSWAEESMEGMFATRDPGKDGGCSMPFVDRCRHDRPADCEYSMAAPRHGPMPSSPAVCADPPEDLAAACGMGQRRKEGR